MAPTLLFDISRIDLSQVVFGVEEIERINPHRGAMRLLDGIIYHAADGECDVAYKDVRDDEFWVAGHIPGRPLFPGVLMIEAAAQLASFMCLRRSQSQHFMGFVAADEVKFRGQVKPGDRLILISVQEEFRRRRSVCRTQGLVDGTLVYEGTITGMPM